MSHLASTIVAPATAQGGAISIIRLSGSNGMDIIKRHFSRPLEDRRALFGSFSDGDKIIDEVVVTYFKAPRSYTGEDCVEISCHGSQWIVSEIVRLLISSGAVAASPGEFTQRAFLNGKIDLSQAEAVADLIASDSRASAQVAIQQMRGGYAQELRVLNYELLNILSLLELELDFAEEDVEFADRGVLGGLIEKLHCRVRDLASSFSLGNVLKNGVPVAIVGKPNVGKSTLLNRLVGEERAIVSSVAGTTRDYIEEAITIDGIVFRFIDTAGLRSSTDEIELIGIERTYEKLRQAAIVIQLIDNMDDVEELSLSAEQKLMVVLNKIDSNPTVPTPPDTLKISAKNGIGISELRFALLSLIPKGSLSQHSLVVSNARHYEALQRGASAFSRALQALSDALPSDLIASEIRNGLYSLQEITGEITTEDILGNIFKNFCIGK